MEDLKNITASQLYDFNSCPHRVWRDIFDDHSKKDPINPFIQLLWDKGTKHEQEIVGRIGSEFINLLEKSPEEKEKLTLAAMRNGDSLIYGGRITYGHLVGQPDLLRRYNEAYIAGDIKSGSGLEGGDDFDGSLKPHYALQLAHYTSILENIGFSAGRFAFIWDIDGNEIKYVLEDRKGKTQTETWWDLYQDSLGTVSGIIQNSIETEPAYSANCKLCHWYSTCKEKLYENDDLTLLPELGAKRKIMMKSYFKNCSELANADLSSLINGKKTNMPGIGPDSLIKFQKRAQLRQSNGIPYMDSPLVFAMPEIEIFYDIEVDPLRDICYLHGFIERLSDGTETFTEFMVNEPTMQEEERIFAKAIEYLNKRDNWIMYYYSPYEKTWWRKLQSRYPHLLTSQYVEELYSVDTGKSIDLYHRAVTKIIWPTIDHSIKTLARYFGFNWRDTHPSGAASIEWFDKWINSQAFEDRQRILDYNEDDCIAMRVVLDGIRKL